jgi:hypothetical protein
MRSYSEITGPLFINVFILPIQNIHGIGNCEENSKSLTHPKKAVTLYRPTFIAYFSYFKKIKEGL